jgi:hypothetical protein
MGRKEIDLHSEILEILKKEGLITENDSWGSAGPDIYIKGKGVIEIKRTHSVSQIQLAYKEIINRTKPEWNSKNLQYFAIITPVTIQIYHKKKGDTYNIYAEPDLELNYKKEFKQFISFLKNDINKIDINLFLKEVLSELYREMNINHLAIMRLLIHFDKKISFVKTIGIIINQDTDEQFIVECEEQTLKYAKKIFSVYFTSNISKIKEEIRYNWSHYQIDSKKSSLGKYYTPPHLIKLVKDFANKYLTLKEDAYVLDSCAGCGSFLEAFKEYNIIGRDIDPEAVAILKELGYNNIDIDNSLSHSSRTKYNLSKKDNLLIVGNPPYNHTSSKNKRYGTNKKFTQEIPIDDFIKSKDFGVSFIKHYASLEPDEIIILHPLSYLIKESNFKNLNFFTKQYKLDKAIIFSSNEFGKSIKLHKTQFPIVCAKYTKGSMSYDDIKKYKFKVLNENFEFSINNLYTIDDYGIRKYPASQNMIKYSDIDLYHYNIRDTNSLKTSGNFSCEYNENMITIQFDNLYQYSYLNCYRRYFPSHFLLGNISPLCVKERLNEVIFRDICIMDTIINNQNLSSLNINNKKSFLYTKFLINNFKRKKNNNIFYSKFIDWLESEIDVKNDFKKYFINIFNKMLQDITN